MIVLRDYQKESLAALYEHFASGKKGFPLINACVGSGKSILIAKFSEVLVQQFPHMKILNLVHTKELIEQNHDEFVKLNNGIPSSVYSASLGEKSVHGKVVYAGIQSIWKMPHIAKFDVIMVDEVHLISDQAEKGMYRKFIEGCIGFNPQLKVAGFTGTPFRDSGMITDGDTPLFSDIVYDISIRKLLDMGFLSPLVLPSIAVKSKTSSDGVKSGKYDFNEAALAELMDDDNLIEESVNEYVNLSKGRHTHLVFGCSIAHCYHLKEHFEKHYRCEVVHGGLKKKERERIINAFKNKELNMLINMGVLSTGFNVPRIDCIGLFRATKSLSLYIQIAGRGLRLTDGKENCLWLDFTDTTERLGPVDSVEPPPTRIKGSGKGEAPVKLCYSCERPVPAQAQECTYCGVKYEINSSPNHGSIASNASILKEVRESVWRDVMKMTRIRHKKKSTGSMSLCINYLCGINSYKEWRKPDTPFFNKWWDYFGGSLPYPKTVDEAIERFDNEIKKPTAILVDENGKYPEIKDARFD